jgi:hypothetical protein
MYRGAGLWQMAVSRAPRRRESAAYCVFQVWRTLRLSQELLHTGFSHVRLLALLVCFCRKLERWKQYTARSYKVVLARSSGPVQSLWIAEHVMPSKFAVALLAVGRGMPQRSECGCSRESSDSSEQRCKTSGRASGAGNPDAGGDRSPRAGDSQETNQAHHPPLSLRAATWFTAE